MKILLLEELAWLAGLLEGEGCFQIRKSGGYKGSIAIAVQMSDEDVVRRVSELMQTKLYGPHGPYGVGKLPTWQTISFGYNAAHLMEQLLPFMGKRRASKIQELLDYHKTVQNMQPNKSPDCCPNKKYHAKGLCSSCYMKKYHKEVKNAYIVA